MDAAENQSVVLERYPGCVLARFPEGRLLDPVEIEGLGRILRGALKDAEPPNMIISLETVGQISSLMLGVLAVLQSEAQARGGRVVLVGVPVRVRTLLDITNLSEAFPTYDTVEEAQEALA